MNVAPLEAVYAKNEAFVYREIAEEAILVPVYGQVANMEALYVLGGIGSRIWSLIDGHTSLALIKQQLMSEFEVTEEAAEADLLEFVQALKSIEALRQV